MTAEYFMVLGLLGVAFFAVAGALLGYEKNISGFGVVVVATVTALGGGTLRDILLNKPVFWIATPEYLYSTYGAVIAAVVFIRYLPRVNNYYFLLVDAVGMALFNIIGIEKALINGSGMVVAITMGITTGIFGGLIRDVICREVPTVMRSEPYASACLAGGAVYAALFSLNVDYIWCILGSFFTTIFLRLGSLHWGWHLTIFRKKDFRDQSD
ncbi:trimeric intracellular cation channel family protein [Pseudoalteromonas sp. BSi20495]|uniref:trimeric intracellular cation channel family protein n=1 Tax=Pseudoalteromonas sp. BSi20495 TaxID=386429 RepID=UPI00023159A9|nr:trimeric intracellular cation channel family protein [Pseudoalteromonas sp. BSi20495]GAA78168.1 UPF0126 membrane protein VC_2382 [Pseudoalteromonas sp. BSi20495]